MRHDLNPELVDLDRLKPLGRAARRHPRTQIGKIARSIEHFGVVLPVLIDREDRIIAGTAVVEAARRLELRELPAVRLEALTEPEARSLRLALDRLAEDGSWDDAELSLEISDLLDLDAEIDLTVTGFETGELDLILGSDRQEGDESDLWPTRLPSAVVRPGDCWALGQHRLIRGDALDPQVLARLMAGEKARLVLTDPPYNVPIRGHVSGLGVARHDEFAMASGEMSPDDFSAFLAVERRAIRTPYPG